MSLDAPAGARAGIKRSHVYRTDYVQRMDRAAERYGYTLPDRQLACAPLSSPEGKSYFAAIDLLGDFFKEKIFNESSAWEATASLGYHFSPALALSGDLSYGRNPQFTEETKALLRLTYNMTYTGIGGKK